MRGRCGAARPVSASQSFTAFPRASPVARRRPSRLNATGIECVFVSGQGVTGGWPVLPVPDLHRPVTSRREVSAVGTERTVYAAPNLRTASHGSLNTCLAGRRQVPDLHQPVRAGGGEVLAVGVEGDADDRIWRAR